MSAVFEAAGASFTYPGAGSPALGRVSVRVPAGRVYALLGPNGSGKSTLLKLMVGLLRPESGTVLYRGRPAAGIPPPELAREVGVVPQSEDSAFPLTVRELVAMGRYPHLGAWRREGPADRAAIESALRRCDVAGLEHRPLATLSGGERQRARIARALAQRPAALVLDEPTAALDVRHEMAIFELLVRLAARDGVTVVVVTHQLNLAARYADRVLLLESGRAKAEGPPADVIRRDILESVYRWPVLVTAHPGPGRDRGAPQVVPLAADATGAGPNAGAPDGPHARTAEPDTTDSTGVTPS